MIVVWNWKSQSVVSTPETVAAATSTGKQEENKLIIHLVEVELSRRAGCHIKLCTNENFLRGGNI